MDPHCRQRKGTGNGEYDPLCRLLPDSFEVAVELRFDVIANAVDGGLPPSAYDPKHPMRWSNTTDKRHVQAVAWLKAGYEVTYVDYSQRSVRFRTRSPA